MIMSREIKERRIGEIFSYPFLKKGEEITGKNELRKIVVKEHEDSSECDPKCAFYFSGSFCFKNASITGSCYLSMKKEDRRTDGKKIYFEFVEE